MQKISQRVLDIAIQRGFVISCAEIYGSSSGFYDYGPVGCAIKRKMQNIWREIFITKPGFLEIDGCTILPHEALVASGHATNFSDPIVVCKKTKKQYRADHILEEHTSKSWESKSPQELNDAIKKLNIKSPDGGDFSEVGTFNLMFKTSIGADDSKIAYLRPETAQNIFMDFKRIFLQNGSKLPLAIGQIGKSYRNEISPRQGLIRMREFTQMELEYFFDPQDSTMQGFDKIKTQKLKFRIGEDFRYATLYESIQNEWVSNEIMATFLYWQYQYYQLIGLDEQRFHFAVLPKDGLPHYSKSNVDLEVQTSFGNVETAGTAYRTDFDLKNHQTHSKQELAVFVPEQNSKIIAHVVEPSLGVDRPFYAILEHCFREKTPSRDWEWFSFPPSIAPYTVAVFPLMKKDNLMQVAQQIVQILRENGIDCMYSQTGSIGKRYARADEIGVPYCVTIDYDSIDNNDVTLRFRDDAVQIRLKIDELKSAILQYVKINKTSSK